MAFGGKWDLGESGIWRKVGFGGNRDLGENEFWEIEIWGWEILERNILGQQYFSNMGFWENGFCGR